RPDESAIGALFDLPHLHGTVPANPDAGFAFIAGQRARYAHSFLARTLAVGELLPAIPAGEGAAFRIEMAGTSPAMTPTCASSAGVSQGKRERARPIGSAVAIETCAHDSGPWREKGSEGASLRYRRPHPQWPMPSPSCPSPVLPSL